MATEDFNAGREFQKLENRINEELRAINEAKQEIRRIITYGPRHSGCFGKADNMEYRRAAGLKVEIEGQAPELLQQYMEMAKRYGVAESETVALRRAVEALTK